MNKYNHNFTSQIISLSTFNYYKQPKRIYAHRASSLSPLLSLLLFPLLPLVRSPLFFFFFSSLSSHALFFFKESANSSWFLPWHRLPFYGLFATGENIIDDVLSYYFTFFFFPIYCYEIFLQLMPPPSLCRWRELFSFFFSKL